MARFADDTAPPASAVPNTPAGGIAADTVQGAINELDGDKAGFVALTPAAASESGGDITLDAGTGAARNFVFTHTMTGAETLLDPVNLADGESLRLEIDPDGQTLSWDTGYVGSDLTSGSLPAVSFATHITIYRSGSVYVVTVNAAATS